MAAIAFGMLLGSSDFLFDRSLSYVDSLIRDESLSSVNTPLKMSAAQFHRRERVYP